MAQLTYRPDIDGLRAVAVLLVVAYHYKLGPVTGGFVGVDVFFVISGFLITSILKADLEGGTFSLLAFYRRRFLRIIPALAVTILGTLAAGYFWLLPNDYAEVGTQSVFAALGISNFWFLSNSDYFDAASDLQPMLHTWSLAVEEQFYVVWPPLLAAALIVGGSLRRNASVALAAIIVISLALSVHWVRKDQPVAFYMLHTRAWELAAGALLAFLPRIGHRQLAEVLNLLGLALIAAGAFLLTAESAFPGLAALAPVAGACLVVWPRDCDTLASRALSLRPMVWIGLISYSLYLWHWPVLVLHRLGGTETFPDTMTALALVAVSTMLAALSWYAVERPFRRLKASPKRVVATGLLASAAVSLAAYAVQSFDGFSSRLPARAQYFLSYDRNDGAAIPECFLGSRGDADSFDLDACVSRDPSKPSVLLVGESFANHYIKALRAQFPDIGISAVVVTGCRPTIPPAGSARCAQVLRRLYDEVLPSMRFDAIILSARWSAAVVPRLADTVERLSRVADSVVVLGPSMEYDYSVPKLLAKSVLLDDGGAIIRKARRWSRITTADQAARNLVPASGAAYFSAFDVLCPSGNDCLILTPDGVPMHRDYGHFTEEGSHYVVARFKEAGLLRDLDVPSD